MITLYKIPEPAAKKKNFLSVVSTIRFHIIVILNYDLVYIYLKCLDNIGLLSSLLLK